MSSIAVFIALFLAQGFLLQTSVALTGEAAPRYGRALLTALLGAFAGGLASVGYSLTAGLFVSLFVSSNLSWAIAALVGWFATGAVYKMRLGLRPGHGMLVALLHQVMAGTLSFMATAMLGLVG